MPLYIKSTLIAATRNPGVLSNSSVLYKTISSQQLADRDSLIALCKSFLVDAGINYKANTDQFSPDGSIDLGRLYSEFEYVDGRSSVDVNVSLLQPLENGSNEYIDTSIKVGELLFTDNLESPEGENEASYSFSANIFDSLYVNRFYYDLANQKCFAQLDMGDQAANADSVYVNYSPAKLISFYFQPSANGGGTAFIINVVFVSNDQFEYQEDLSGNFYQSGGQYYANSNLDPLYLMMLETFFPFIVLKESQVIHGPVYSVLNSNGNPIEFNAQDYVSISQFDFQSPTLEIISCSMPGGVRDGQAIITYSGDTIYVSDTQICGETTRTRFIHITPLSDSSLYLYKDFTTLNTYLVDVYAYNFRYIDYKNIVSNVDTYNLFKDNGSVATQTVKYASEQIDFSKYNSIKENEFGGVDAINMSFLTYQTSRTESAALLYELIIPVNVLRPEILSSEILGSEAIITSNYGTNLIYYFGEDASLAQTVSITDTSDGQNQKTSINVAGKKGSLNVKVYNYFYTLDISDLSKALYISENTSIDLGASVSIPSLSIKIRTGSPLTDQTIYDESAGTSSTSLSFTDCLPTSFSNYYVLASYSSNIAFNLLFTFTLNSGDTSLDLLIGGNIRRLQSGVGVSVSREEIFSVADQDGAVNLTLVLNEDLHFTIPVRFKNTSSNSPQITSVTTPVINFDGSGGLSATFSISHRYSRTIGYRIENDLGEILLDVVIPRRSYEVLQPYFSTGSTNTENVETEIFQAGNNATSLFVRVTVYNLDAAGNESTPVSLSSSSVSLVKRLNPQNPAAFKFYEDSGKTVLASKIERAKNYYAFLQLYGLVGDEISVANYGDYIDPSTVEIIAIESEDDNTDLQDVSVIDLGNYLYEINVGSSSPFNDTSFSIKATFNSLID